MNLSDLGWNDKLQTAFNSYESENGQSQLLQPARVVRQDMTRFTLLGQTGEEIIAELAGRLKHQTIDKSELPTVGDWVIIKLGDNISTGTIVSTSSR